MTTCSDIVGMLDFHLDRELGAADTEFVTRHLDTCGACSRLLAQRIAMRDRLRQAARDDAADLPPGLATRVRRSLAPASAADRWVWRLLPVAAAVILIVAGARWYRLQDGAGLSPAMQVGFNDHVHCALLRKYPTGLPMAQMVRDLGPGYADLVPAIEQHLPGDYRVESAHRCAWRGRSYVHVVARSGSSVLSLVIAKRAAGEAFENDLRTIVSSADGVPLYTSAVERFSLAGFETRDHLVYLISDLDQNQNLVTLEAMTPQLRSALD
jgi:hypothetical protein